MTLFTVAGLPSNFLPTLEYRGGWLSVGTWVLVVYKDRQAGVAGARGCRAAGPAGQGTTLSYPKPLIIQVLCILPVLTEHQLNPHPMAGSVTLYRAPTARARI